MGKLIKYLKDYKLESVLGPLFKMLEASFELFVPLVMARIIDVGIRNQDASYILKMGGILVLLGLIGLICSLTAQYFAAKAAVGFSTSLRNDLFAHIGHLSYSEQDKIGTATLITRMTSDVNQVQSGLNLALRLLLRSPFIVFGAMIMAFTVNVRAAMVFVVAIPALSVVVFGIMGFSMPLYKKVQRQLDQVTLATRENLTGARVIRAFNRQEDEISRFEKSNDLLVRFQIFVGKISALMNPVTYVIINLAIVAVVWTAGKQVDAGIITQGETVALVNYMSQILVELIKMANLIVSISKALACANRISTVLDEKSSIMDPAKKGQEEKEETEAKTTGKERKTDISGISPAPDKVRFCQVDFAYKGAKENALTQIDFSVKPGQTIGIIGGTGSGKSSLVNLIPRFYDVRQGAVLVDGRDVREYSLEELRHKIGVVPQKAVLFKGTLRENMQWGKKDATDPEIYEALSMAQAREFVDSKEKGLDLPIEQNGKNLSGGQRQRLTIARALVKQPEILIMDDSASALDFATDASLRKAIREGTRGMTVFIVSQRATTIRNADQILVLDDGCIVGWGTHKELFESCEVYREICLSQLSKEEVQ
ncbi:MAG: ABC transporter ATP-binding protein [Lachnospiraceae bacterium]|jgi:ATP-binding cassette subfamily B multidrug efflux pump|nr:ABC transporter ATP-binding protein [Lachnospiraceae bacterium]